MRQNRRGKKVEEKKKKRIQLKICKVKCTKINMYYMILQYIYNFKKERLNIIKIKTRL